MKTTIKRSINLRSTRFGIGCLFAAAAFMISLLVYGKLKVGLFFAVMFLLAGAIRIPGTLIGKRFLVVLYTIWFIVTAFVTLVISQFCQNEGLPDKGLFATLLGILLILCLYLILSIATLKIRISVILVSAVLIVFSCINYFVFVFRGSEIVPADILSITTAGNVAAEYSFHFPAPMFYAVTISVVFFFASFALPVLELENKIRVRIFYTLIAIICAAATWIGTLSIRPLHWLQTGSVENGFLINFTALLKDSFPKKPEKYNSNEVEQIADKFIDQETNKENSPDIIVVMDESFADLSKLGKELSTDIKVTPYIDSLQDSTLHGYALSSVFGGGTPNSEYEFLTGNSFLFLPSGAIAYQQFIKEPQTTIANELKDRGYSTVAMHQYLSSSWMRSQIWPLLGFEECLFLDDFPQEEMIRNWGTDRELFEKIASVYEEHTDSSDSPVFMFAVTIQNHGGYDYSGSEYSPEIHLQGYSRSYPDVEQYLTCIHETDKAVEWLIDYFEQSDREVVILFYGDHFPRLSDAFFEEMHGGSFETLDERMLQYEVPFFIWTNYESGSEEIELVSMNYLAGLLYQKAGLELPPYNQFLEQVRQTIPACNSYGYYSESAGGFISLQEAMGDEKQALLEYNYLEWNSLFDSENRNETFFPVP